MNRPIRIYLSPANHPKPYANGENEKNVMEKLSARLAVLLSEYEGIEVCPASVFNKDGQYTGRPEEAKSKDCHLYVALHSNAGKGKGACVFYHPSYPLSKALALGIVGELNRISPIKSNRAVQPAIYSWDKGTFNFGELRVPAAYGITPVLIEHEFHDTTEGAKWLTEQREEIAKADARAIAAVLGLYKKGDVTGDGETDNLDAARILMYDVGLIELTEEQRRTADINGDGKADNLDVKEILKNDTK